MPAGTKVFVRVDTNHGITGWGEITGLEPKVGAALAESLFELLDGENPTRIEHLWQKLYRSHRDMRGGPFMVHTLSAIDMAHWDIAGKAWGVPVYRLLGGPCREKVRIYPTPKAQKAGTGGPHPMSGDPPDIQQLVKFVKDARDRVGPDGTVMFDAHCAVPPPLLIQFAAAIQPYDVLFIEEPAVPGNIEVFRRLKEQIRIPLATGERDRTIWGVLPYLQEGAIDILQPDCAHTDEEDRHARRSLLCAAGAAQHVLRTRRVGQPARRRVDPPLPDPRDVPQWIHDAGRPREEELPGRRRWQRLAPAGPRARG